MPYLKLFTFEFRTLTERMSDAARGRLIMAMINYIENGIEPILSGDESAGEEPTLLEESMVWPTAKARMDDQIDAYGNKVDSAASARESKRGRKNSETKNKNSEIKSKKTEIKDENSEIRNSNSEIRNEILKSENPTLKTEQEQELIKDQYNNNDIYQEHHIKEIDNSKEQYNSNIQQEHIQKKNNISPPYNPPSLTLTPEQKANGEIVRAWERVKGACSSRWETEKLLAAKDEYGQESVLDAIEKANKPNVKNKISYIMAILKGGQEQQPAIDQAEIDRLVGVRRFELKGENLTEAEMKQRLAEYRQELESGKSRDGP